MNDLVADRYPSVTVYGEEAVLVRFGDGIDVRLHRRIQKFCTELGQHCIQGVVECVPAYDCVSVVFNPDVLSAQELGRTLHSVAVQSAGDVCAPTRVVEIPVWYGGTAGPDLALVAEHTGLSTKDVVTIHSAPHYTVFMLGFVPGFPYLGGMDKRIAAPRKAVPRKAVPAGSVGIAGEQTGVYPLVTPGGWQLIGRTPLRLFDPECVPPTLLMAGDVVRFRPISEAEFTSWPSLST